MGAGASSVDGLETMLTATFLLGHALTRAFPDIYTIDDFDVNPDKKRRDQATERKAHRNNSSANGMPQIRAMVLTKDGQLRPMQLNVGGGLTTLDENAAADLDLPALEEGSDCSDDGKGSAVKQYSPEEVLIVQYQGRNVTLALDSLDTQNDDGWTPMHAAAHQHTGVEALKLIVSAVVKSNGNLNKKTTRGPGSFVSNCTPLHLASAYGINGAVQVLVEAGADVNAKNSIGWTPLYEALHRGYVDVVEILIKAGAKTDSVIPPCYASPQHGQFPLAHACRQGHEKVVKLLLSTPNISNDKDQQNEFGWTALHECAFYNRAECIKLMLVYGCDGSLRTKRGLRAIDMTLSKEVQTLLLELVPEDERESFLEIGKNVRAKAKLQEQQQQESEQDPASAQRRNAERRQQVNEGKEAVRGDKKNGREIGNDAQDSNEDSEESSDEESDSDNASKQDQIKVSEGKQSESFRLLGDLPNLGAGGKKKNNKNNKKRRGSKSKRGSSRSNGTSGRVATPETGVPDGFCCSLTGKLMSDPVLTPFGDHCYQRNAVERWLKEQGNLDPVTGMPLATCELILNNSLRIEINDWQLQESLKGGNGEPNLSASDTHAPAGKMSMLANKMGGSTRSEMDTTNDTSIPSGGGGTDDLYDF